MVKRNAELTKDALESLKGKWGLAVGTFLVYSLIIGILSSGNNAYVHSMGLGYGVSASLNILFIIIGGPIILGSMKFSLNISRGLDARFEQLFDGFNNFGKAILTFLLVSISVAIGFIFLIIPGLILSIMFSQAFFILADNKDISAVDALKESVRMMKGYKLKYLGLSLRFIPWMLLCIITLGIGFLWLVPYMYVTFAKFHDDIKANPIGIE
ncbi:MAG: DUF975 family protein [Marinifilaceae bacterium]